MKIQKIGQAGANQHIHNKNFTAGKTSLYSDFDGTFIPAEFSHDSVCNYNPPVNQGAFKSYFDKIWTLFGKLRGHGEESKFDFVITTGRNLAETNYFLNRLKEQDLWVPLPEKLVTCNGQDEFYKNVKSDEEFYRTPGKNAFVKENVNQAKRDYYKSKGWDYDGLMAKLRELLTPKRYEREIDFLGRTETISQKIQTLLRPHNSVELEKLLNEINAANTDESGIRKILEAKSQVKFPDISSVKNEAKKTELQKKIDDYNWHMGELAHIVYMEKTRRHEILENIPTTRSSKEYGGGISLQSALERIGMRKDDDYIAFSDDGELGIRIGVSKKYKNNIETLLKDTLKFRQQLPGKFGITKLKKGSYGGKEFEIKPPFIDKFEDTKKLVNEIIDNKTNDLIIVAGDGANDCKMLNVQQYVSNQMGSFIPQNAQQAERFNNIPLVSIFVDNRAIKNEKPEENEAIDDLLSDAKYFNYDGRLRFIHVDPNDPEKPHTLEEAVKMAVCDYAKHNEEFKKNLSPEMQKMVEEYKYSYPHDKEIDEQMASFLSSANYENLFVADQLGKISRNFEKIIKYEMKYKLENMEDLALDENSDMDSATREYILYPLSTILLAYSTLITKLPENKVNEHVADYLEKKSHRISWLKANMRDDYSAEIKMSFQQDIEYATKVYKKLTSFLSGKKKYNIPEDRKAFIQNAERKRIQKGKTSENINPAGKVQKEKTNIKLILEPEAPKTPIKLILPDDTGSKTPVHLLRPDEPGQPVDLILPEKPEPPEKLWLPEGEKTLETGTNKPEAHKQQITPDTPPVEPKPGPHPTPPGKTKNLPAKIYDFMKSRPGMITLAVLISAATAFCAVKCKAALSQDKNNIVITNIRGNN